MNRLAMSPPAAGLLRALIARASVPRDRILLTEIISTDWHSLTFVGERHRLELRFTGPDAAEGVKRMSAGLEEVEFAVPGHIVADVGIVGQAARAADGTIEVIVEALTIEE